MNLQSEEDNINIFKWEEKRLQSFTTWPYSSPMKPNDLAKAGFFYTGREDLVQCVFCRQILGQWSPEDIPLNEHIKFNPHCPFVNQPCNVGNVPIVSENSFPRFTIPIQETHMQEQTQFGQDSMSERPVHFKYASYESRLQSFYNYPQNKAQTPIQLAEAGFFYTGEADNVKCFFCDGGLRSWDPVDNPWTEHARWFPKCAFLRLSKGEDFIKEVTERFEQEATGESPGSDFSYVIQQSPPAQHALQKGMSQQTVENTLRQHIRKYGRLPMNEAEFQETLSAIQNTTQQNHRKSSENEEMEIPETDITEKNQAEKGSDNGQKDLEKTIQDLEEERMCKICMDEKANVVFLDCGHLVCCEECATQVRKCPICRQIIVKIVKTYMS